MISSSLIIRTFLVAWRSGAGLRPDNRLSRVTDFCNSSRITPICSIPVVSNSNSSSVIDPFLVVCMLGADDVASSAKVGVEANSKRSSERASISSASDGFLNSTSISLLDSNGSGKLRAHIVDWSVSRSVGDGPELVAVLSFSCTSASEMSVASSRAVRVALFRLWPRLDCTRTQSLPER